MDLSGLNPPQSEAVVTTDGPVLILAGAGSGKTRVLTFRIAYLLEKHLARPEEILAVTFTNKAAAEMSNRVAKLLGLAEGSRNVLPWMGTFHSICVRILKIDGHHIGLSREFSIYDPSDQLDLVKQAMEARRISVKDVNPRAVLGYISSAKNELISPEDYAGTANGYFAEVVADIYPAYQKLLKENNSVDFDDLLCKVVELFKKNPEVLAKYQRMFKYVLVDEYQDTNHVQYILVNMIAKENRNICVVGDDDQSIYAFRGANIRNILNFKEDYPEAKVVKLEQNYRSTKNILEAAHAVVKHNKQRTDKKLWTDQDGGEQITLHTADDEQAEAEWVVESIKKLIKDGTEATEIAILYRTNAQSRVMEEWCLRLNVPYKVVGGVRFYERKEIKDVLAYIKCLYNTNDTTALLRIINTPKRGIGDKMIDELVLLSQAKELSLMQTLLDHGGEINSKLGMISRILSEIKVLIEKQDIVTWINTLLEKTGYLKSLQDGTSENESRIENIKELISLAARYIELPGPEALSNFLADVSLLEGDQGGDENEPRITLMTIHAAKGLEFEHVFVVGMEEGLFPHSRVYTEPKELEEERRLAYVAITRAKKNLSMVHTSSRLYFGSRQTNLISRFVQDIPAELLNHSTASSRRSDTYKMPDWEDISEQASVVPGQKVRHEYFGFGTVISVNGEMAVINFGPAYGKKEMSLLYAPLQRV